MKHLFSFLLLITCISSLFGFNMVTDSCDLSIDYVVNYDCPNSDSTIALIAVDVVNPCSAGYQVYQNGSLVGNYNYSETSDTIIIANNFGTNQIIVCDLENQICCDTANIFTTCSCAIYEMDYMISNCVDSTGIYNIQVDMDYLMVSDSFELGGGGNSFGNFAYVDLPVTIGPFNIMDGAFEIAAFDLSDPFCFDFIQIDSIESCPMNCAIENLIAEAYECDENDEVFFDFEFDIGNQSGQFLVMIDSVIIDTLNYGSPFYTSGPINYNCDFFNLLTIIDLDDQTCGADFVFPEIICCDSIPDCGINTFVVSANECDSNGNFDISFSLDYADGNSDSFLLELDENVLATFPYGDTLYQYGSFPGDCMTDYKFILRDQNDETCISNFALLGTVCCAVDSCLISDLIVELQDCDDNQNFFIDFEFNASNTNSSSFTVSGNGTTYDTLPYGETFYTIGPFAGDCSTIYEFIIADLESPNCQTIFEFSEPVCCSTDSCSITNFVVEAQPCLDTDIFYVDFDFDLMNQTSALFFIQANNMPADTFIFGQLPYTIGPFDGDCSTIYEFTIQDYENENCQATFSFEEPICCDTLSCQITNLFVEAQECDTTGQVLVDFEFDENGINSGEFVVRGNGTIYDTLPYGLDFYTIGPIEGDCNTIYEFIVHDLEDIDCQDVYVFDEVICCDSTACVIDEVEWEIECIDNEYFILVNFNYSGIGQSFSTVDLDGIAGTYLYADLPVTLGPFPDNGGQLTNTITITDEAEACQASIDIDGVSCNPDATNDQEDLIYYTILEDRLLINPKYSLDQVKLFDLNGRLILDRKVVGSQINLSNIHAGVYIIQIQNKNQQIARLFFKN